MRIPLCGCETQSPPITTTYFESRWNLDYSGQFLGIEFDPETGEIKRLHVDDPGTENEGWYETPDEVAEFCRMYPKTAHAVKETISRLRLPLQ